MNWPEKLTLLQSIIFYFLNRKNEKYIPIQKLQILDGLEQKLDSRNERRFDSSLEQQVLKAKVTIQCKPGFFNAKKKKKKKKKKKRVFFR